MRKKEKRRAFPRSLSWNCRLCSTSSSIGVTSVALVVALTLCYSFVLAKRDSVSTLTIQFADHCQGEAENKLNGTRSCRSRAADPPHVVELNNSESRTCGAARQLYNLGTKWLDHVLRCGVKVISGQKMSLWGKDPCHSFFWDWCQHHVDNKTQMCEKQSLLVLERGWEEKSYIKEGRGPGDQGSCFNLSLLF